MKLDVGFLMLRIIMIFAGILSGLGFFVGNYVIGIISYSIFILTVLLEMTFYKK